jgi:hypothetical protein
MEEQEAVAVNGRTGSTKDLTILFLYITPHHVFLIMLGISCICGVLHSGDLALLAGMHWHDTIDVFLILYQRTMSATCKTHPLIQNHWVVPCTNIWDIR